MPFTVTAGTLMREQREGKPAYDPEPGTRYEVATGKYVTLLPATMALQDTYLEAIETLTPVTAKDRTSREIKRELLEQARALGTLVTKGEWPADDDLIFAVVERISADFTFASSGIDRPAMPLSDQQLQLAQALFERLAGPKNGIAAKADMTS